MNKNSKQLAIIVLAAGKGTRMKSKLPKVLHEVAGKSMLQHVLDTCESLSADKIIAVTAPDMDDVRDAIKPHEGVIQDQQDGTGGAVRAALSELKGFEGSVVILNGDVPMVSTESLQFLIDHHEDQDFGATVMIMVPPNPYGYGRIVQNDDGTLKSIVEQADASEDEQQIRIVNSGVIAVKGSHIAKWINALSNDNKQGEYYLTDLPQVVQNDGQACGIVRGDYMELRGINSRDQLSIVEEYAQTLLRYKFMDAGVTLLDPKTTYFAWDTKIGEDVVIGQNVVIGKGVEIAGEATIHPFTHIEGATIDTAAEIGPYARIRPKSAIGKNASVGNFIEVNRSTLHDGVKSKHMSYLGDAIIGSGSNIGAGTVIANYDGFFKKQCTIGENTFVGSNSTLVSPLNIGEGALIAAGSVITEDISKDAIGVARAEQENRENAATDYRSKKLNQKKSS